jgi:hypothetical protein
MLRGYAVDPGFRSDHLVVSTFDLNAIAPASRAAFVKDLIERSAELPGIESAAVSPHLPLVSGGGEASVSAAEAGASHSGRLHYAGPGFFRTLHIPLQAGREFLADDRTARVAVVNDILARQLWPERNPVRRTVVLRRGNAPAIELEVVGVVSSVRSGSIWEKPEPQIYVPWETAAVSWIARTQGDPARHLSQLREFWNQFAPETALWDMKTGEEIMAEELAPQRLATGLLAAFGCLGIVLASVGLYSLTAFGVARRRREIGTRIALGALPASLVLRILARACLLALVGLSFGVAASLKLSQLAAPLIREVSPTDSLTFVFAGVFVLVLSVFAALTPSLRAARVDPAAALRSE